jgi:hypothetical protein
MQERSYHRMFEDILILLVWNEKAAPVIANTIKLEYFGDPVLRHIISISLNYYMTYKKCIRETIHTEVELAVDGKDSETKTRYFKFVEDLWVMRYSDNMEYTLKKLGDFIKLQKVELIARKSATLIEASKAGNMEGVDEILTLYREADRGGVDLFDPGVRIKDVDEVLKAISSTELYVNTGIPELDALGICPTPNEMMVVTAATGKGKTWFAGHLLKTAHMSRKKDGSRYKTCHISLEMSRGRTIQRYWQTFFSIAKTKEEIELRYFGKDRWDRPDNVLREISKPLKFTPKISFEDVDLDSTLREKVSMLKHNDMIIKDFPMGQLSMSDLYAYLDSLEVFLDFKPDILVVDYPDLMKLPKAESNRLAIGSIYESLKGLARERNIAIIAPCQVNRAGNDTNQLITRKFIGEDFSKIQKCDMHITYNQTDEEHAQGIARLYVDKNRNGESGDLILISQNYAIGQFCLDSRMLNKKYNSITVALDNNVGADD